MDIVMSSAVRVAMLNRRPTVRPLVITRSTFAGAGAHVGHWLGDNFSDWPHYRISISGLLQFNSIYQVPMVGSDVCGYADNTTEQLCSRWAMLGAFSTFYRNHNNYPPTISQEFYLWPTVTAAAKKAIDIRYRLLDYLYTQFYKQTVDGTPVINPLFYLYPQDSNTFGIDLQYFYGPGVLVSPVTEENATSVDVYLPDDIFYDLWTYKPIRGEGKNITVENQTWTDIPLHFRGGQIFPLRVESAMTTTELRTKDFEIVIAPGLDKKASGQLYLDDGESLVQNGTTLVDFTWDGKVFTMTGKYGFKTSSQIVSLTILGVTDQGDLQGCSANGGGIAWSYDEGTNAVIVNITQPLTGDLAVEFDIDLQ